MEIKMADKKASLVIDNNTIELPILTGTLGPDAADVGSLTTYGHFTFDSGFNSTAACESKITYIDGDKGVLLYRGYPIEQLAAQSNYLEVCYLIINGELPTPSQYEDFCQTIYKHRAVDPTLNQIFTGFHHNAHPMAMILSAVGGLSAIYQDEIDISDPHNRKLAIVHLVAQIPTIVAMSYRHSTGAALLAPQENLDYAKNFLYMMFGDKDTDHPNNEILARALDRIFTLHADHEQNASTSTVRLAGSTGANPYACICAGIAALWGPAHGGANEAALNMLKEIGDVSRVGEYIKRAKDPQDKFRLMGFGHRVYKNYDPRAKIMRETCYEVLNAMGVHNDPIFKLAMELEKIALEDEYFIKKKLYPNVDFYSGVTQSAIGIPSNMFTAIFTLARTVGWISHWNEMLSNPYRLGRPRQIYTGSTKRDYIAINKR